MINYDDIMRVIRSVKQTAPLPQIIETTVMVDEVQRKKHKRHRINKKWRKRYGVVRVPKDEILYYLGKIVCHPTIASRIKKLWKYDDDVGEYVSVPKYKNQFAFKRDWC